MGLRICILSVFVVVLITGAQSADKQLGEGCGQGDTCVSIDLQLVCDSLLKKCLLQTGQVCNTGGRRGLCTTGAHCSRNSNTQWQCQCVSAVYSDGSGGTCNATDDKYGGACPCNADSLVCNDTLNLCQCQPDMLPNLSDGTCVAISDGTIGKACTSAEDDTTCTASDNLQCSGGKCVCNAGFSGVLGGDCSPLSNEEIGQTCTTDNMATNCGASATTNMNCTDGVCTCMTNYTGIIGGSCSKIAGILGGPCSSTCGDTMDCVSNICKAKLGSTCAQTSDCSDEATMICDELAKKCLFQRNQDCSSNTDKCSAGATCTDNVCTCNTDLTTAEATMCQPKAKQLGSSCTDEAGCETDNTECTNNVCVCEANFIMDITALTCKSKAGTVLVSLTLMVLATLTGLSIRL